MEMVDPLSPLCVGKHGRQQTGLHPANSVTFSPCTPSLASCQIDAWQAIPIVAHSDISAQTDQPARLTDGTRRLSGGVDFQWVIHEPGLMRPAALLLKVMVFTNELNHEL
jgi:hypothetical protein